MALKSENKKEIESLFQKLGNTIVPVLSNDFEKAVIGYFMDAADISHCQFYIKNMGEDYVDVVKLAWDEDKYDDVILDSQDICKEIYDICKKSNSQWTFMTYTIENDYSFNVDFGYETIEDYDAYYIRDWQAEYL